MHRHVQGKQRAPTGLHLYFRSAIVFLSTYAQLVWSAFKEVRRPQLSLVRDIISGVLHPVALAMPELVSAHGEPGKVSALVRAMYCGVAHEFQAADPAIFNCFCYKCNMFG